MICCFLDTSGEPVRVYDIPILSGSTYVGQLYDAKTDQFLYGRFLWQNPIAVNEADITSVETDVYIEESVIDRSSHFGLTASIKASMFAGLVKVSA